MMKVRVRKRSSPNYVYTKLCDITETDVNIKVNVYGVIQFVRKKPTLTSTGKLHAIVDIIDETVYDPFSVSIFYDPSSENTTLELKENYIVRFHRVKVESFNNIFDGRVFSTIDVLLFHPNDEDLSDDDLISWCFAKTIKYVDSDAARVRELIKWWSEYSAMSLIHPLYVSALTGPVKFVLICKVLKVITLDNENSMVVTVTDGTKCPLKVKKILTENSVDTALSDRGCFRKNVYDIDIIIFNASDDLKRLQEGLFVKLGFVQLKHPTEGNEDSYVFVLDGTDSFICIFPEHHNEAKTLSQRIITNCSESEDNRLVNVVNEEHADSLTGGAGNFAPEDTETIGLPTNEPVADFNNTLTSPPDVLLKQTLLKLRFGAKEHDDSNSISPLKSSTQHHESESSRNTREDNVATSSWNYVSKIKKDNSKAKHNSVVKFNEVDIIPELSPVVSLERISSGSFQRAERAKRIIPIDNNSRSPLKTSTQYTESEFSQNTQKDNVTTMSGIYGSEMKKDNSKSKHNSLVKFNRVDRIPKLSPIKSQERISSSSSQRVERAKIIPVHNISRSPLHTSTQHHESEFSRNTQKDNVATMSENYGSENKKDKFKAIHNSPMKVNRVDTIPKLGIKSVEEIGLESSKRAERSKRKIPVEHDHDNDSDKHKNDTERIYGQLFGSEISNSASKETEEQCHNVQVMPPCKKQPKISEKTEEQFHSVQVVPPCKKQPRISGNNKTLKMEIRNRKDAERFPCLRPDIDSVLHNRNYFEIKGWIKSIAPFEPNKKEDFVCGYCEYCHKFKPYSRIRDSIQNNGRILCTTCDSRETESELKLVFHFHAKVTDEFNQTFKLVVDTDAAAKLFGCSVEDYLKVPWLQGNIFSYLSKTIITEEESKQTSNSFSLLLLYLKGKFYLADVRHKPLF